MSVAVDESIISWPLTSPVTTHHGFRCYRNVIIYTDNYVRDQSRHITLFESGTAHNQALSQCNLVMIIMCKTNHAITSMDSVLTQENLNDCTAITLRWFMSVAVPSSHDLCDLSSHDASHSSRACNQP